MVQMQINSKMRFGWCEDSIGVPLGIRLSRGRRESEREQERDPREYSILSNIMNLLMYASTHFTQSAQSVPTLADNLNTPPRA